MRQRFKKPLIYLLMTMLAFPTWIVVGMANATRAKAAEIPEIEEMGILLDGQEVDGDISNGYLIELDGTSQQKLLEVDDSDVVVNVGLAETNTTQYYPFSLDHSYQKLVDYFSNKTMPQGMKDYLISIANGINPIFYLKAADVNGIENYQLIDGFGKDFENNTNQELRIDYDYPAGTYDYTGRIISEAGASNLISISLGIARTDYPTIKTYNVSENIFSPNNDGVKDSTQIDLEFSEAVDATLNILDQNNQLVKEVYHSNSVTDPNPKIWNGDNSLNNTASDGVYKVQVIIVDADNNQVIDATKSITVDTLAPELLGVEDGKTYDSGVNPTFAEGTAKLNGVDFTSGDEISDPGDYKLVVTDTAGNQTAVNFTIEEKEIPAPVFNITKSGDDDNLGVVVSWNGVGGGVDSYKITVDGVERVVPAKDPSDDSAFAYEEIINLGDYGTYNVLVVSQKGNLVSPNTETKSVEFIKAVAVNETPAVAEAPTVKEEPNAVTISPEKVQASEPQPKEEEIVPADGDENGIIKGEEESSSDEEEDINWTPWIVLFVLIILAGAATGGYFYWFNGDEEVATEIKEPKKTEKPKASKNTKSAPKSKKNKKAKRW